MEGATVRPAIGSQAGLKAFIASELESVRRRTLDLLAPVSDAELMRQHSPIMSPLVWDLAHIGWYEEYWLLRRITAAAALDERFDDLYDAFLHERSERPSLPLLSPTEARTYLASVRSRALDLLAQIDLEADDPLLADGFVYSLVVQHEHQHVETMLQTLQLRGDYPVPAASPPAAGPVGSSEVLVGGGPFVQGTDARNVYDNERPAHELELPPFRIDTAPVTNRAYLSFVEAGGYHDERLWERAGWTFARDSGLEHPLFWVQEGERSWGRVRFGRVEELPLDEPAQHVSWYEADAFARWAGKRLPTEAEWEKAASWDAAVQRKRRFPWGDEALSTSANLGGQYFRPAPVGAYPAGVSAVACHQLIGDVWEWTASDLAGYPGFRAFPYREYSEVFFGPDYKVLRGGSWATHASAVRTTFRNWDLPIRRQLFAGFRCARDG